MPSGRVRCLYRIKAARLVEQRQGDDEYAVGGDGTAVTAAGGFCIGTLSNGLNRHTPAFKKAEGHHEKDHQHHKWNTPWNTFQNGSA